VTVTHVSARMCHPCPLPLRLAREEPHFDSISGLKLEAKILFRAYEICSSCDVYIHEHGCSGSVFVHKELRFFTWREWHFFIRSVIRGYANLKCIGVC